MARESLSTIRVVLIGAGNVATNLAAAFANGGLRVVQVVATHPGTAFALAQGYNASYTVSLQEVITDANLYVVAIPDREIPSVASNLPPVGGIVVHTSGSTPLSVLAGVKAKGYGVLYPFQTFTRNRQVSLKDVPVFIESDGPVTNEFIGWVARLITGKVLQVDSQTRAWLHLSGVFANNFANHMLAIAENILATKGMEPDLIKPLIAETIAKAFLLAPGNAQTGPAIRHDESTIAKHIEMLKELSPELAKIYKELSLSIQSFHQKNS